VPALLNLPFVNGTILPMTAHLPALREADPANRARYGGKGASLAALARASFEVPDGFIIPVDVAARLRGAPAEWPPELRRELLARLAALVPAYEPVAVRSSAADEDGAAASFAGQHETVLGVTGGDAFLEAVARCLASADAESARAYRQSVGADAEAAMALVVQRMVPAVAAGVAFSIDPVTGSRDHVVVEAVAGLGDALVSGQAEGQRFLVHRQSLTIQERPHSAPVLSDDLVIAVVRAALRAEDLFGSPQDIEFAVDERGKLWLLQSRPVTSIAASAPRPDGLGGWYSEFDTRTSDADLWTSANVQEILPGLLTPLTITTFNQTVPRAYTEDYHELGLLSADENPVFMGCFYNRAFLNMEATRLIASRVLGFREGALEQQYLGGPIDDGWRTPLPRLKTWRHRILTAPRMLRVMATLSKQADRAERAVLDAEAKVRAVDPFSLSSAELQRYRERILDFAARISRVHLRVTGVAGSGYDTILALVRPVLGDEAEGRVPTLFTGLPGVESARISLDLWELSRTAIETGIAGRLREPGFDPRDPALPARWQERYAAFIERHGHRGLNEMETAAKTWRWDPAPVVEMVASYVDIDPAHAPPAVLARQEAERLALTREIDARLGWAQRRVFRWLLPRAQGWVALRERTKSILVRAARLGDWHLAAVQARLVDLGVIREPDDLFFLSHEEVSNVLANGLRLDLSANVAARRREFERNRHVILPERFRGRPVPLPPAEAGHAGDVLKGTPVSPGRVTGRARVILDPKADGPLQPGEILVAPVTDAGWTPLFALAAGLVVDMGSALSHGSTVAREYGLPAVVNVRQGTARIRTGDLVAIDGIAGTVTILEEPPAA
jgi:phosphohistidine swiveling domain-containing protein